MIVSSWLSFVERDVVKVPNILSIGVMFIFDLNILLLILQALTVVFFVDL